MGNIQHMVRIERNDDVVNPVDILPNERSDTVDILTGSRHEQGTVGMAEIELSVDNGRACGPPAVASHS